MKRNKILPYIVLTAACAFLLLPLVVTGIYSFSKNWDFLLPSEFTLEYYQEVFADRRFVPALLRGILISIPVAIVFLLLQKNFVSGLTTGGTKG